MALSAEMEACFTLLDRVSLLSLRLLAGERRRFLMRLVNPSAGMMFEGAPGKKQRTILGAAAEPRARAHTHTPPLECRSELLLSGHVGANLHVTGFSFLLWSFSPAWCLRTAVGTRRSWRL